MRVVNLTDEERLMVENAILKETLEQERLERAQEDKAHVYDVLIVKYDLGGAKLRVSPDFKQLLVVQEASKESPEVTDASRHTHPQ